MKRIFLLLALLLSTLLSYASGQDERKVMARSVPERLDDFVFENNLIAGRIYGKALEGNPTSPGIDIWVKKSGRLVADEWYAEAQKDGSYYHHDHGEGKDCYKVAVSLGGGASVPLIENRFQFPATNYRACEILEEGPEKVVFVLHYPEWQGDGMTFSLNKKITLISDSYFCKVEDTYTFSGDYDEVEIAAGVYRHDWKDSMEKELLGFDRYAIWEKASDQSAESEDGMIGVAVYMPFADAVTYSHGEDHGICVKKIRSGETLTYFFGNCWSKGDIRTAEEWFDRVNRLNYVAYPFQDASLPAAERAEDLLGRLTADEKASLMMHSSPEIRRLGIRRYNWWNEALHGAARAGLATSFPQTIGMSCSWDPELLQRVFDVASTEQRIKFIQGRSADITDMQYHGLTVWTPNINIFRDPRWGRGQETYGEDPFLTATLGEAVVKGLQGQPSDGYDKLHACLKHYAVHSGSEADRHTFDVEDLPYRDLRETYLYAFENIVKKTDVQEVMCAYNRFEGKPCCGSDKLLTQILRNEWGYKGLVVSDCWAINDFYSPTGHQTFPGDTVSSAVLALRSGTDLECGESSYATLSEAIRTGAVKEEEVDASLRRLLTARFRLGEMDPMHSICWNNVDPNLLDCPKHQDLALEMGHESIVLLENDGILPLAKEGVRYAVTGVNAKSESYPLGNYFGSPAHVISPFEGICRAIGAENVTENTAEADVVIYIGGINPDMEGEEMSGGSVTEGFYKGDRTTIELPKAQRAEIDALCRAGKKVVLVCMSGGAISLAPEKEKCNAIVQAWYGGETAGKALADIIFGDCNPSGHLSVTFYASDADLPDMHDYRMDNRTYRYFCGEPLWAFGHGLSYTTFRIGRATLRGNTLKIKVTNTGPMDGDDVIQVYMSKDEDKGGPVKTLREFRRISLKAGESKVVEFNLTDQFYATFNPRTAKMEATPGHFHIWYGDSSDNCKELLQTRN